MLTAIQQKLFEMLKEIDGICRTNDIHYTVSGGTAIGAVRHGGFMPWDDDIDIYMTRDNWEQLKTVWFKGGFPINRVLESAETDIAYSNSFGRYVATDSTAIHSHQLISEDAAGHVIDIFVFDQLHIDNFGKFMEDFMLYSDLMNETMGYSTRFDMNIDRYHEYYRRTIREGKQTVIDELINSFTHQDAPGWTHYIMEFGSAPLVFPREVFDEGYTRIAFEDSSVEILTNIQAYLVCQYGDEWAYIPPHNEREGHDAIFSSKLPYQVVRDDYRPFINAEELHKAYIRRKNRLLKANQHRRAAQIAELNKIGDDCVAGLMKKLEEKGLGVSDLRSMMNERRYAELTDIFAEYYDKQLSADFIGRHDKHSTLHRFYKPVLMHLDDEIFALAVENLIRTERMSKAKRLIDVYEGYSDDVEVYQGIRDNETIGKLKAEMLEARELIHEYSIRRTPELYNRVCEYLESYPENSQIKRIRIRMLLEDPSLENHGYSIAGTIIGELMTTLGEESIAYGELLKYRQDMRACGAKLSAEEISGYRRIYEISNNGYIRLEIEKLLAANGEFIEKDETESENIIIVRSSNIHTEKKSLYGMAKNIYRKIASKDDHAKAAAWQIATRTRDRVVLLEHYENRLDELRSLRADGSWDELEEIMKPHEEAVLRNLEAGLGLCVHPELSAIQNEIFTRRGESALVERIESLIPPQHRKAIGE